MNTRVSVISDPIQFPDQGISDHAPVRTIISDKVTSDSRAYPLPPWIFKHEMYPVILQEIMDTNCFMDKSPPLQASALHEYVKEAGKRTRDHALLADDPGIEAKVTIMNTISRIVWRQNTTMAKKLLLKSDMVKMYIEINNDFVSIIDPIQFDKDFNDIRRRASWKKRQDEKDIHNTDLDNTKDEKLIAKIKRIYRQRKISCYALRNYLHVVENNT